MTAAEGPAVLRPEVSCGRYIIAVTTLRGDGRPPLRKTRFRLLARLCRTGLVTRKVPMKGFRESRHPQTPTNSSIGAIGQRIRFRSLEAVSCRPNRELLGVNGTTQEHVSIDPFF